MDEQKGTTDDSTVRGIIDAFITNLNFLGGPIRVIRGYIKSMNYQPADPSIGFDGTGWQLGADGTVDGFIGSSANTQTTKSMSDATGAGNTVFAHGLGRIPSAVRVCMASGGANYPSFSTGFYNGTNQSYVATTYSGVGPGAFSSSSLEIGAAWEGVTTSGQTGVVSADSTNVTITWTRFGTPTGTIAVLIEAVLL